jgi:hypothetical protein
MYVSSHQLWVLQNCQPLSLLGNTFYRSNQPVILAIFVTNNILSINYNEYMTVSCYVGSTHGCFLIQPQLTFIYLLFLYVCSFNLHYIFYEK